MSKDITEEKITIDIEGLGEITATPFVLNRLSQWASEASNSYENDGLHSIATSTKCSGKQIYKYLKSIGLYDND